MDDEKQETASLRAVVCVTPSALASCIAYTSIHIDVN